MNLNQNNSYIEINRLISSLITANNLTNLISVDNLKKQINANLDHDTLTNTTRLVNNLIFKQFSNTALEALRETVSNAVDAHVRAHTEDQAIKITLKDHTFKIKDRGDGMGVSEIPLYLVPGLSSNPEAIYNIKNGIAHVTGRFGRGAIASLYFLSSHTSAIPMIDIQEGIASVSFKIKKNEEMFTILMTAQETDKGIMCASKAIPFVASPAIHRNIHLKTFKSGTIPLEIDFREINHQVCANFEEGKKNKTGTTLTITSPLIKQKADDIVSFLRETFLFLPHTPLTINGERINPPIFDRLPFTEGELFYQRSKKANKGHLIICEEGKRIIQYETSHPNLFEKVGLSFHRLNLSQERASLDYDSLKKPMINLVKAILSANIDLQDKFALLNSLLPLLNKMDFAEPFQLIQSSTTKDLAKMLKWADLAYIDLNMFPYIMSGENWRLLAFQPQSEMVAAIKKNKVWYICPSDSLKINDRPELSLLNEALIEVWVKWKYPDIKKFSAHLPLQPVLTSSKIVASENENSDFKRYTEMPGADSPYQKEVALFENFKEFKSWIDSYKGQFPARKYFYFLSDLLKEHPILNHHDEWVSLISAVLLAPNLTLSSFESFLKSTIEVSQKLAKDEAPLFLQGIANAEEQIHQAISQRPFSYTTIVKFYYQVKSVIKEFGYSTTQADEHQFALMLFFEKINAENVKDFHSLLQKIPLLRHRKKTFKIFINMIKNVEDLLDLTEKELHAFIDCFPDEFDEKLEEVCSLSLPLQEEDMFLLSTYLLSESYSSEYQKHLVMAYYYAMNILQLTELNRHDASFTLEDVLQGFIALSRSWKNAKEEAEKGSMLVDCLSHIWHSFTIGSPQLNLKDLRPHKYFKREDYQSSLPCSEQRKTEREELRKHVITFKKSQKLEDLVVIRNFLIAMMEKFEMISDLARPYIYTLFFGNSPQVQSDHYIIQDPTINEKEILLHEDSFVVKRLGNAARAHVQTTIKQSLEPYFCIGELVKNGKDALGSHINIEAHTDAENNLILIVKDNGTGMGKEELEALRCPGSSTKHDDHFGMGFLSSLSDFSSIYVSTRKDHMLSHLTFQKIDHDVLIRMTAPALQEGASGTTLILKKTQVANIAAELIKIRSIVMAKCRYMQNVEITFNDQPVTMEHSHAPLASQKIDGIEVLLKAVEGGLYCNGIKMGALDEIYTDVLPENIKSILENKKAYFTVIVPQAEQLMNRGHFVEKKKLIVNIQKAILLSAIKYCHSLLLQEKSIDGFTTDFWYIFDHAKFNLPDHLHDLQQGIADLFSHDTRELKLKKAIIEQIRTQFVGCIFPEQQCDLDGLANLLKEQCDSLDWSRDLQAILNHPMHFALLLLHLPIQDNITLFSLRRKVQDELKKIGILKPMGSYDEDFIKKHSIDELKKSLKSIRKRIKGEIYKSLIAHFEKQIVDKLNRIKFQQSLEPIASDHMIPVENFFKKVADRFFNKKIEVHFFSIADGSIAKAERGSNRIFISTSSIELTHLIKMTQAVSSLEIMTHHRETIKKWINTLVHELGHLEEDKHQQCAHTQGFFDTLADRLQPLWMTKNEISILDLFIEAFQGNRGKKRSYE